MIDIPFPNKLYNEMLVDCHTQLTLLPGIRGISNKLSQKLFDKSIETTVMTISIIIYYTCLTNP